MESINVSKTFDLDLNSEAFNAFKTDFNTMLKGILSEMEKNESDSGEISVTMKIGLEEREIVDRGYTRTAMVPSFSHKVVSKMQFKNEKKGSLTGNFVLKFDSKTGKYYLEEVNDGQTTFFDDGSVAEEVHDMGEVIDVSFEEDEEEDKSLPGSSTLLIEDKDPDSGDDFDGVEYDEEEHDDDNGDGIDIDDIDEDDVPF